MSTQTNIKTLFSACKGVQKTEKKVAKASAKSVLEPADMLCSDDPEVQAFYRDLTPYERIAHTVAVEKLGTSYTVRRTHGFLKWKSLQK